MKWEYDVLGINILSSFKFVFLLILEKQIEDNQASGSETMRIKSFKENLSIWRLKNLKFLTSLRLKLLIIWAIFQFHHGTPAV